VPLGLGLRRAGRCAQRGELGGQGRPPTVRRLPGGEGHLDVGGQALRGVPCGGELVGQHGGPRDGRGQLGLGVVDPCPHLEVRRRVRLATGGPVGTDEVAGRGDGPDPRVGGDQRDGGVEIGDECDPLERAGERGLQGSGRVDGVQRPSPALGQLRPAVPRHRRQATGDQQPGAAAVGVLEVRERGSGVGHTGDDDRVGHPAQRGRHGHLVTGADGELLGERAEHPAQVRAEHGGGAVGRRQPEGEGVPAGLPGGAVGLRRAFGLGELDDAARGGGVRRDRVLVCRDQRDVGVLLLGDLAPALGQPVGGDVGAVGRLTGGHGEAVDLGLAGRHPGAGGRDLTG